MLARVLVTTAMCAANFMLVGADSWMLELSAIAALLLAIAGAIALFEIEPRLRHLWARGPMPILVAAFLLAAFSPAAITSALAHGGGLDAQGCHNDRKGGTGYHCHPGDKPASVARRTSRVALSGMTAFRNCTAARAAGASPVRAGDSGYGRHLDRDGDGIGCE